MPRRGASDPAPEHVFISDSYGGRQVSTRTETRPVQVQLPLHAIIEEGSAAADVRAAARVVPLMLDARSPVTEPAGPVPVASGETPSRKPAPRARREDAPAYRAALVAARRLARSPQDRRLGHVVCGHLRTLLAQSA